MPARPSLLIKACASLAAAALVTSCAAIRDEAGLAGKTRADFPEVEIDFFKDMDGGVALSPEEAAGRNTWLLWTGGNDAFWDYLANNSFGVTDLLKTADSRKRGERFSYYGLINDPDCEASDQPDEHGLYVDRCVTPAGLDETIYGRSSGIVGLRMFPNPTFDDAARAAWDAERYYSDPDYYNNPELVRPYRPGMACGFCHVSPHPLNPPADPEKPEWRNISSNIGGQYFWFSRVFGAHPDESSYIWQLINSAPPGTLDTSFIASDNINNPRTMNAIFNIKGRLAVMEEEELAGGALNLPGAEAKMAVPHVLKDGADSVGLAGALARVYINIGTYHQEWVRNFKLIIGGDQTPMDVANARKNSVYWQATQDRLQNMAAFFIKAAGPMPLKDAPGGKAFLTEDEAVLDRGKTLFADVCASCHSSKQPASMSKGSPDYKAWMRAEVKKPDFLEDNFLSDDHRYSVAAIQTNACSTLATNATEGHIWDNFSSATYKSLPSVGEIDVLNPSDGERWSYAMPAGGRGYHRTPSLVAMWATAPYFHNNGLGDYNGDPTVEGRMAAFEDAVGKLLWPERRKDIACDGESYCPPVYRTTTESYLKLPHQYVPGILKLTDLTDDDGNIEIGPIPKGTPVNLLANIDLNASKIDLAKLLIRIKKRLKEAKGQPEEEQRTILRTLVPDLLEVSKCPDFEVDRGHYVGTDLPDEDKYALIAFLKTL